MIPKILQKDVQCRPSPNPILAQTRDEIAAQTAEFLARGGEIKSLSVADSGVDGPVRFMIKARDE